MAIAPAARRPGARSRRSLPFGGGSVELKFLLLPEGEDPDSLVRAEGPDAFRARLATALPLSTFLLDELRRQSEPGHADGRARLIALARPLLGRLPAGIYRELLIAELAEDAARDAAGQTGGAARSAARRRTGRRRRRRRAGRRPRRSTFVRKAISLLLHYPAAGASLAPVEGLDAVEQPGADLLRRLLETTRASPDISSAGLLERFRDDPEGRHLGRLVAEAPLDDAEAAPAVLADSLERLVREDRHRKAKQAQKNRLGEWQPQEDERQSQLKLLIAKGKEQGYLTYGEVNDHLPSDIVDPEQIEDIVNMINDMGITVFEKAPDAESLLLSDSAVSTDDDAADEAAAALATVDSEFGRTTDPVRMYMREMGTVELLTREGEIRIAKRIEEGLDQVRAGARCSFRRRSSCCFDVSRPGRTRRGATAGPHRRLHRSERGDRRSRAHAPSRR
jgi:hypothetical protein